MCVQTYRITNQEVSSTTDNRLGHDSKEETAVTMISRKRVSPVGHAGGRKMARSPVCMRNLIVISTIVCSR